MEGGLTAEGGVAAESAVPDEACDGEEGEDPERLEEDPVEKVGAGDASEVDADREEELVVEGGGAEGFGDPGGEEVEGEEVAAGDVFKGEHDEDEGGDFEDPEGEEGHGEGEEELEEGGQADGDQEPAEGGGVGWEDKVLALGEEEGGHREEGDAGVDEAAGGIEAEAVGEVIDGFEEELADGAFADVGGDLPIVLGDGGEGVDDGDEQVIGGHLGEGIGADGGVGALIGVDGAPEEEGGQEGDEAEGGAAEEIDPVGQGILNADIDDVPVFAHDTPGGGLFSRGEVHIARKEEDATAIGAGGDFLGALARDEDLGGQAESASAADAVGDPDDDIFAFAPAEAFVAGQGFLIDGGGEVAAAFHQCVEFLGEVLFAGGEGGELGVGEAFHLLEGGLGLGDGTGGAFGLFHEFELLVLEFDDGFLAGFDFVAEGAVFLVFAGLELLDGVAFDQLFFALDFEFEFAAVGFELHGPLAGGFEGGLGALGFGLEEGALWRDAAQFSLEPLDSAVAFLEDEEFFDNG